MTHKDIIVRLRLEGHSVNEIARINHHSQRTVDNYIGTFESVLTLKLYGVKPELMARPFKKGSTVIREHLKLIDEFYED